MRVKAMMVAASVLIAANVANAQESGIRVRSVRVLATNPDGLAEFYEKAFGMSETRRAANSATFKEIIINSGSTADQARKATSTAIVIATRPKGSPPAGMASLILEVPNLEKAIESAKANGATVMRPPAKTADGLSFAFLLDPDGNQVELVMSSK